MAKTRATAGAASMRNAALGVVSVAAVAVAIAKAPPHRARVWLPLAGPADATAAAATTTEEEAVVATLTQSESRWRDARPL